MKEESELYTGADARPNETVADYRRRKDKERKIEKRASLGGKSQHLAQNHGKISKDGKNSQKEKTAVQVFKKKKCKKAENLL